ncbi:SMI1/KNR4 family protein [Bacillus cereus]
MDYELLKERIEIITSRIKYIGGEVQEVCIDEPSSLEQIIQVEEKLGIKLPNSFKKVLLEFSGNFSLRWFLPDDVELPNEFTDIFLRNTPLEFKSLSEFEKERKDLVDEVFSNLDDEYDVVWHNKLAFCEVGNGDYLAFDMKDDIDAPIIYLSHDDGEGHVYKIANNFIEFIENWSRVAFVGCEDWQWLPFTTSFESGINPDDEPAKKFRNCLELNI